MLYQWQETTKAIQICKLASKSLALLQLMDNKKKDERSVLRDITERTFIFAKNVIGGSNTSQTVSKEVSLEDYLLFSETSLGYQLLVKDYKELPTIYSKQTTLIMTSQEKPKLIVCSICHLTVRGLVYTCSKCGHGGHYEHLQEWVKLN